MFVSEVIGRAQDFSRLRGKNPSKKDLNLTGSMTPKYVQVGIPVLSVWPDEKSVW